MIRSALPRHRLSLARLSRRTLPSAARHCVTRNYSKLVGALRDDPLVTRLRQQLIAGSRAGLSEAITLVENTREDKQRLALALMLSVLESQAARLDDVKASHYPFRIGITGPPGAGKSTFLERFGMELTERGSSVAVLAVDPSSQRTGGSLLGDKTRMQELSRNPKAFIRPSPASGVLGGVTRSTQQAIVLCEAAGYDFVIVETVGAGQNEYVVADMTDVLVLLIPPAGGDELQGIKRGIVELADLIIVNKADGDLLPSARRVQGDYLSAVKFTHMHRLESTFWRPTVLLASAVTGYGMDGVIGALQQYRQASLRSGRFLPKRAEQNSTWMWRLIRDRLVNRFKADPRVRDQLGDVERRVADGSITPFGAAQILLDSFLHHTHH